jgi:hypothetical protein
MGDLAEAIRASRNGRKPEKVAVPEWGRDVYVRELSAREQMEILRDRDEADLPVRILLASLVDEDGGRALSDEDYDLLAGEGMRVVMRLFAVAARLNGFGKGELEAAVRDFETTPAGSSGTG